MKYYKVEFEKKGAFLEPEFSTWEEARDYANSVFKEHGGTVTNYECSSRTWFEIMMGFPLPESPRLQASWERLKIDKSIISVRSPWIEVITLEK